MSEPLGEKTRLTEEELFTTAAMKKFQMNPESVEKKCLRHYSQLVTHFDDASIGAKLTKVRIPIEARVTIYGGFTGQLALMQKLLSSQRAKQSV